MEITLNLRKEDYEGPIVKSFKALINSPLRLRATSILEPVVAYLADNIDPTTIYYMTLEIPNVSQEVYLGYVPIITRLRFPYKKEQLPKIIAQELELITKTLAKCQEVSNFLVLGWDKPLRPQKPKLRGGVYTLLRKWGRAKFDALGILENYETWQFYLSAYGISNPQHFLKDLNYFARFTPGNAHVTVYTAGSPNTPKTLRFKDLLGGEHAFGIVRE